MIFDWNDEELANTIWVDTGESDDHIVPYPDGSENKYLRLYRDHNREWDKEGAQVKPTEQKKSAATIDSNGVKQGRHSQCTTYGGVLAAGHGSRPDFSPSNSPKVDINAMCNERLNKTTEISYNESSRSDEKPQPGDGVEIYKQPEDKEERDLVNCDWVNIDSFDDLDRIFSSNDQMSGHASVGNADEPWSSSKNITTSPEMSISLSFDSSSPGFEALGSKPEHFETKVEHLLDQHWPAPGFQKMNNYSCHSTLGAKDSMINFETVVGKSQPIANSKAASEMVGITSGLNLLIDSGTVEISSDSSGQCGQVKRQRKLLKCQKILPLKGEAPKLQNFCGSCISEGSQSKQYDNQIAPDMGQPLSSMICQQKKFHGPWKVNMTPQEKIAKLRRRQKMRAMVAIQKQQQQLSHQALSGDNCISPRWENQMQLMAGRRREINGSLSILPSFNQHSPMEQNSSNIVHMNIDKYSNEDSVLHQLQDVINKLGIQTRLCIRDSLFRLAQSSIQRQHGSDTSITNRSSTDVLAKEGTDNHKRFLSMSDVETETNPIDRTVAHLLFHRPLELSGKLAFPTNLRCETKTTAAITSLPKGYSSDGVERDLFVCAKNS